MQLNNEFLVALQTSGAHGLQGFVKAISYLPTDQLLNIPLYKDDINLVMEQYKGIQADRILIKFKGIDNRENASVLVNSNIYVQRRYLPSDTVYTGDLIGAQVKMKQSSEPLIVQEVYNFGSGFILDCGSQLIHWSEITHFERANKILTHISCANTP